MWKKRHPTPAQQRRIAARYATKAPKDVRITKSRVSLLIGRKRVSYPYTFRKHVSAIGNWSHSKKTFINIDSDVRRKNRKALLVHEAVEQYLAKERGLSYRNAHNVAERHERAYATAKGKSWKSYQNSVLRTPR
jgi:hypothetical protein